MIQRNQKLSNEQIATIFYLHSQGFNKSVIARSVKYHCGVALSTTYYHLDKVEKIALHAKKQQIRAYLTQGLTTRDVARMWQLPLAEVNHIYAGKRT
jgi:hypothetical protein